MAEKWFWRVPFSLIAYTYMKGEEKHNNKSPILTTSSLFSWVSSMFVYDSYLTLIIIPCVGFFKNLLSKQSSKKQESKGMASNNSNDDLYAVLGLNKECTSTELRTAYKKLALVSLLFLSEQHIDSVWSIACNNNNSILICFC